MPHILAALSDSQPVATARLRAKPDMPRLLAAAPLLALLGCVPRAELVEGPLPELIERGIQTGTASFDHSAWDRLVRAHARERGRRFDYAGIKAQEDDLDRYLAALGAADLTSLPGDGIAALFINAYNAYTVKTILNATDSGGAIGVSSIRDIPDVFTVKAHLVGGHRLSLDDMEHGVLRPIFRDPRVHFVVNCASISCPPIPEHAFTGDGLEAQLEAASKRTLADPDYIRVEDGHAVLTRILDWFGSDFTDPANAGAADSVARFVARYNPEIESLLERAPEPPVRFLDYDWALNEP